MLHLYYAARGSALKERPTVTFSAIIVFAQFNELEQLDSQLVTVYFPVETVSSPYSIVQTIYHTFIRNSIETQFATAFFHLAQKGL